MYHHLLREVALPDDYDPRYRVAVGDSGLVCQVDDTHVFWREQRTELKIAQELTFLSEQDGVLVLSGPNGTEVLSDTAHLWTESVKNVTYHCKSYLGTLGGEVHEFEAANEEFKQISTLDSRIVQIFETQIGVAVSTLTKLVVLPDRQLGTKLRKNTAHGGCEYLDKIMVCRPNLKIFVYDKAAAQVTKTLALKESVPPLNAQYCAEQREADLGTLTVLRDNVIVSFQHGQCVVIDIEQPCVLQHVSLPDSAVFGHNCAFWADQRVLRVFEVVSGPPEAAAEQSTTQSAAEASALNTTSGAEFSSQKPAEVAQQHTAGQNDSGQAVQSESGLQAQSKPQNASQQVQSTQATQHGRQASHAHQNQQNEQNQQDQPQNQSQQAQSLLQGQSLPQPQSLPHPQIPPAQSQVPAPPKPFVYEPFCALAQTPEDLVQYSQLTYSPHFKFHKYTAPQSEQPLNFFFPFLPQQLVQQYALEQEADQDQQSLIVTSQQLAENYFAISQTAQIALISLSELNLNTYQQLDNITIRKLAKWAQRDAPRAVRLLASTNALDPLYPHVRQMLSTLASKACYSLCFMRDFKAVQPVRKVKIDDIFDIILPPLDLTEHLKSQVLKLGMLVQQYPRALLALIYRTPELLGQTQSQAESKMLSEAQAEFVDLMLNSAQYVKKMNLTERQARDYCKNVPDNQLIALVYQFFCTAKRVFGDFLDSWIGCYLLPQIEALEQHVRLLFLSVFYTFIDVRVQVMLKCRLALEINERVVLKDSVARQLLYVTGAQFNEDIQHFLNNSIVEYNINIHLLSFLKKTGQLQIFAQHFAEKGQIDASLELQIDPEMRFQIYQKLLETADPHEVILKFFKKVQLGDIERYVQAAVGWVDSDFIVGILAQEKRLSVRILNVLARGK